MNRWYRTLFIAILEGSLVYSFCFPFPFYVSALSPLPCLFVYLFLVGWLIGGIGNFVLWLSYRESEIFTSLEGVFVFWVVLVRGRLVAWGVYVYVFMMLIISLISKRAGFFCKSSVDWVVSCSFRKCRFVSFSLTCFFVGVLKS